MLFTTTTLSDAQRGVRRRNGRIVRWLGPGRHPLFWPRAGATYDEVIDLDVGFEAYSPELAAVLPDGVARSMTVAEHEIAILRIDGLPAGSLSPGRYLLWQERSEVAVEVYDTRPVQTEVPRGLWRFVADPDLTTVEVHPYERVVLFVDGEQAAVLGPGRHGINSRDRSVSMVRLDLREQEVQITGQDVMTADKVSVRINLLVRYKVIDPERVVRSVQSVHDALYAAAQIAARRHLAASTLDALLEQRTTAGSVLADAVAESAAGWGIEVVALDLKDVILPGAMREILNQVIQAEKRAAANVILRREETAATRSLANTARLLEQNPTLLRLKELEALERLAGSVGQITVVATPDQILGSLSLPQGQSQA